MITRPELVARLYSPPKFIRRF
ncbi:antitermination protein, partial [Escherichia coli]|nr:antitermination protein [Escherichia coli]